MFSLEMPRDEIIERLISSMSGIPLEGIQRMEMAEWETGKHAETLAMLNGSHAMVRHPTRKMTTAAIYNEAREGRDKHGINILFIDQLSKIMHRDAKSKTERFENSVSDLKDMALALKMPVVLLAQLRRMNGETRPPLLEDIKQCGQIEEDADIVLMPHRPDSEGEVREVTWNNRKVSTEDKVFFYCRKYRNGKTFAEMLDWDGPTTTIGRVRA
jgi:replicative DNA helicase